MFELKFATNNEAFDDHAPEYEIARILARVAKRIEFGASDGRIFDSNGNSIGHFYFEPPENEDKDEA